MTEHDNVTSVQNSDREIEDLIIKEAGRIKQERHKARFRKWAAKNILRNIEDHRRILKLEVNGLMASKDCDLIKKVQKMEEIHAAKKDVEHTRQVHFNALMRLQELENFKGAMQEAQGKMEKAINANAQLTFTDVMEGCQDKKLAPETNATPPRIDETKKGRRGSIYPATGRGSPFRAIILKIEGFCVDYTTENEPGIITHRVMEDGEEVRYEGSLLD